MESRKNWEKFLGSPLGFGKQINCWWKIIYTREQCTTVLNWFFNGAKLKVQEEAMFQTGSRVKARYQKWIVLPHPFFYSRGDFLQARAISTSPLSWRLGSNNGGKKRTRLWENLQLSWGDRYWFKNNLEIQRIAILHLQRGLVKSIFWFDIRVADFCIFISFWCTGKGGNAIPEFSFLRKR